MNLFKRFCAVITIIAIIASFGVTAFATEGTPATVSFVGQPLVAKTSTAGVYEITVTYTASENLGDMGLTMLTYVGNVAEDDPSTEGTNEFTPYDDTMTIVGINQWGKNEMPDADAATAGNQIKFNAKMAEGATGLVMLGGDGVAAAAIELFSTPWDATVATYTGDALEFGVAYPYDAAAVKAAFVAAAAAIEAEDITVANADATKSTTAATLGTIEDANVAIEGNVATVTIPAGTTYVDAFANVTATTFTVDFVATNTPWTPDEVKLANGTTAMEFSIAAVESAFASGFGTDSPVLKDAVEEDITAYVKAQILATGVKIADTENNIEQTLDSAALANIVVSAESDYNEATFNDENDSQEMTYTVTFVDTVENVSEIADMILTVTVTKYEASWDVVTAEFAEASLAVVYDMPEKDDVEAKVKAALTGKAIVLSGAEDGQTYNLPITAEMIEAAVVDVAGETVTVTVLASGSPYGIAVVNEDIDVVIALALTENDGVWTKNGEAALNKTGAELDITVRDLEVATVKAAVLAKGLELSVPVNRGDREEVAVIDVTEGIVEVTPPAQTGETYTMVITVPAETVVVTEDGTELGALAAEVTFNVTGVVTVQTWEYGDVDHNGTVTFTDAQLTAKYAVAGTVAGTFDVTLANVDGSATAVRGGITFTDAQLIAKKAVNSSYQFPIEQ